MRAYSRLNVYGSWRAMEELYREGKVFHLHNFPSNDPCYEQSDYCEDTMIISLYVSLCWVLVATSIALKSKFSNREFSIIYLLVAFIDTNLYYLFGETFHVFEISKNPWNYVSFSLIQSIIIPLFIAIMINLWRLASSVPAKVGVQVGAIIFIVGMETLSFLLKIVIYSDLTVLCWLIAYRLVLFYLQFVTIRFFRRMCSHS